MPMMDWFPSRGSRMSRLVPSSQHSFRSPGSYTEIIFENLMTTYYKI